MAGELLLATLRHVWATMVSLKIDMALMGGIAVAAWQHLRNTRDVDLLVAVKPEFEHELIRRLTEVGILPIRDPPVLILGESRIVQLKHQPADGFLDIRIDLFLADSEYHQTALARRVAVTLPGMSEPVFILSCEDLILFKLVAGRILDRADVAYLLRFNRDTLDMAYLTLWANRLSVTKDLIEASRDAFGESTPAPT